MSASSRRRAWFGTAWLLSLAVVSLGGTPAVRAGEAPFARFSGEWTGQGAIDMADGSKEAIRCKARYAVSGGGQALGINVNCAGDSYRVTLLSNVVATGDSFTGTWQEVTRQVSGDMTGHIAGPGQIQANLAGLGFGLQLAARTQGRQQAIALQSQGTDIKAVQITLRKL